MASALLSAALCAASSSPSTVPTVRLRDGTFLPMVSLGTYMGENATEIELAFQAGFRSIDTAFDYKNEKAVGEALKHAAGTGIPRKSMYVITKVPGCIAELGCAALTKDHHVANLKMLSVEQVNLLLVHYSPIGCRDCKVIRAQWGAMQEMLAANLTRTIGVSNYCERYHVGMGPDPEGLVSYCKAHGVVPQAYSPLGPTYNRTAKKVLIEGNLTTSIGRAHSKSGAQVALRWVTQHGAALVTRAGTLEYLEQDVGIFDFTLTDADMAKLDAATKPNATACLFCSGLGPHVGL